VLKLESTIVDIPPYLVCSFIFSFQKTIFKKAYYQKSLMKQIYVIIALLATVTIGILHLNSGIAFLQNETSQLEDSLITSAQIDESMETNNTNYCFIAPILPGGIELMKKWNKENIVNNKEHDVVFMDAGISREQVWIQHIPQQQQTQDFAIACYETTDPEQSLKVLATSDKPWAVKFREHLKNAHGLDIAQSPMQINELVVNWKE
jgi:hypothetical protein